MVRTEHFPCKGHGFDFWSENSDPACHGSWPKIKIDAKKP